MNPLPPPLDRSAPRPHRLGLPRTRRGRLLAFLGLLLAASLLCFYLSARTPSWYRPSDPADLTVIDTAGRVQITGYTRAHNAIQRAASSPQSFSYSQDEINAYLAVTYGNASGPYKGQITAPMVLIENGTLTIAARATSIPLLGSGIISLTGHAEVLPPDSSTDLSTRCTIVLDSIHLGSLRIPQFLIKDRLDKALGHSFHTLANTAAGSAAALSGSSSGRPRSISREETDSLLQHIARHEPFPIPSRLERKTVYLQAISLTPNQLAISFAPTPLK